MKKTEVELEVEDWSFDDAGTNDVVMLVIPLALEDCAAQEEIRETKRTLIVASIRKGIAKSCISSSTELQGRLERWVSDPQY
jgi:hypothetical protein